MKIALINVLNYVMLAFAYLSFSYVHHGILPNKNMHIFSILKTPLYPPSVHDSIKGGSPIYIFLCAVTLFRDHHSTRAR